MSEDLVGWNCWEEIAMGIPNPGSCAEIIGDPEFLRELIVILCKEHPEWTNPDDLNSKNPIAIRMNSKHFGQFKAEHPEIFNNQNKKLKFKYIANNEEEKTQNPT